MLPVRCFSLIALFTAFVQGHAHEHHKHHYNDGHKLKMPLVPVHVNPATNPKLISPDFFCPKMFVPGRPGGFLTPQGAQGCCFLGKAADLIEIIFGMHACMHYQDDASKACFGGALDEVIKEDTECCRSKNAKTKLDYTEDDLQCEDAAKKSTAALRALVPAYAACQKAVRQASKQQKAKKDPKKGGLHTLRECHIGIKKATAAIASVLDDARALYEAGGQKDFTDVSKRFATLCDYTKKKAKKKMKHPFEKCFYHLRKFMVKEKLTYAY